MNPLRKALWLGGIVGWALYLAFVADAQNGAPLVQPGNLVYRGAFALPPSEESTGWDAFFGYGGYAMALGPSGDSLYVAGFGGQGPTRPGNLVAEVTIPSAFYAGNDLAALPVSTYRQHFEDALEGHLYDIGSGGSFNDIEGMLVYGGRLILTATIRYDAIGFQVRSHYSSGLTLATKGDIQGPYQVGTLGAGHVAGRMGLIPSAWQAALGGPALTGQGAISILSRTSNGPYAHVFNPADVGTRTPPIAAIPLLYYTPGKEVGWWDGSGCYPCQSTVFNGTTRLGGFVFPSGTSSLLHFGDQGIGAYCYETGPVCGDPTSPYKGNHAYPYRHQVWAYNAADLVAVKNGSKQPWEVRPYNIWPLDVPMSALISPSIKSVAFDPAKNRAYLAMVPSGGSDSSAPFISVWDITSGTPEPTPNPVPTPTPDPQPTPQPDTCTPMVTGLYRELLLREPDAGGLAYWVGRCKAGMSEAAIRQGFMASDEYKRLHPAPVPVPTPTPTPTPTPPPTEALQAPTNIKVQGGKLSWRQPGSAELIAQMSWHVGPVDVPATCVTSTTPATCAMKEPIAIPVGTYANQQLVVVAGAQSAASASFTLVVSASVK